MTVAQREGTERARSRSAYGGATLLALGLALSLALVAGSAEARHRKPRKDDYCTQTAVAQAAGCAHEVEDDFAVGAAICLNLGDEDERDECYDDAWEARSDGADECDEVRAARLDLCARIGEARYEPDWDPAGFDDDFSSLTHPNPYFPLGIGNVSVFESGDETTRIEVLDKTKQIDGVTCIVVNDVVSEDGVPIEDTDDWFAQRKDGTVDYCGESVRDYELFEGDQPQEAELVEIDGSFKAGRDGDKPGMLFPGAPVVGSVYRQEWSASNAEDAAEVLSTTYQYPSDSPLDEGVPPALAEHLCGDTPCVVTAEFSPLDPGVLERKFFAAGVGKFLEVKVGGGEVTQLVECNFHELCEGLDEL